MGKKADLIIDLQYGSTGKGLIAGYMAVKNQYDMVVTANMPNAGHTFIDDKGQKMVHKVLPNGVVSPKCEYAMIGPGAVFDTNRLFQEMDQLDTFGYDHFKVIIHPNAVPLQEHHAAGEGHLNSIGSTQQGCSAAMIHKMNRNPNDSPVAWDIMRHELRGGRVRVVTNSEYNGLLMVAKNILLEGAQGFSLGINERFYPFCTSRDCIPARFMADMGVPLHYLRDIIGTARTYPIRVGGNSGPCYEDQQEITWEQVGVPPELTTVTQRERRVFTFSPGQIIDALWATNPNIIFLNFCNYIEKPAELQEMIDIFGKDKEMYLGYGPAIHDVVRMK